jgi:hypothetical protein
LNIINKQPVSQLGYKFIAEKYIPKGSDENFLRYQQTKPNSFYRKLSALEIEILVRNRNTSDDWNSILVTDAFSGELVKNCKFYGLVRIGALQPYCLEFHDYKMPVGLYNSTIISCDIGDNVSIDQVNYLSHYIIGNEVMISNVGEIATTNHAKFGAGIIKEDEKESVRTWIELCNENGGRGVLPFDGMLAGDAYMWSKYRSRTKLLERFFDFTQKEYNSLRGYYGSIGDRTIIKNCGIIKDVKVGTDAYFKGATKLKNLTVNSDASRTSQIGEGCELVNGIIGFGCRIFYGVKAVRFVMASHAQLKYGARLINSYLGNNSTISCCEVLNTLIFPGHEQHHNNSFLCAALVQGQSNIAAGATIGSNHNSRGADGEIVAGRGFWPGLCVSLKHNSKFAAFTIIAKGDYPAELHITLPFSLINNDVTNNKLTILPAYWFMYNMYALARNAFKYADRDKRQEKIQTLEFDFLAPDTAAEMLQAVQYLKGLPVTAEGNALVTGFENTKRPTEILKIPQSIAAYTMFLEYYFAKNIFTFIQKNKVYEFAKLKKHLVSETTPSSFTNLGGQMVLNTQLKTFLKNIEAGKVKGWNEVHQFYRTQGYNYEKDKLTNAYNTYLQLNTLTGKQFTLATLKKVLQSFIETQTWICNNILQSRQKDYTNPFRKMVYEDIEEMHQVIGKLEDNSFIQQEFKQLDENKKAIKLILKKLH